MSLPKGYKRLEYIRSSGTQYIDSGFIPNQDTRVYAECVFAIASSTQALFGCRVSSSSRQFQFVSQGGYYRTDYNTTINSFSSTDYGTAKFYIDKDKNVTDLNGDVSYTHTYAAFTCPGNMYIFATNNNGSVYGLATATLYKLKVWDNGTLVRDYIPCETDTGEVGLWDDVNSRFYASATTTDLIAGPEVARAPDTPSGLRVVSKTDTSLNLEWNDVEDALGYRLYRDGRLLADLTETAYTDAVEPFASYEYSVSAYNENGFSDAAVLAVSVLPENPTLYLITDRTQADVNARNEKGTYNASDLNRAGAVMEYVAGRMREQGHLVSLSLKTDWAENDWPTPTTMAQYLGDLSTLRNKLATLNETPAVPADMEKLTYIEANDIEEILEDLDYLLTQISLAWFYTGEVICGEV